MDPMQGLGFTVYGLRFRVGRFPFVFFIHIFSMEKR